MAWKLIADNTWDSEVSTEHLKVYYESRRDKANMQYRFKYDIYIGDYSWYDWALRMSMKINGESIMNNRLVKPFTSYRVYGWSYTYTTSWQTIENKLSGTVPFWLKLQGDKYNDQVWEDKRIIEYDLPVIAVSGPVFDSASGECVILEDNNNKGYFQIRAKAKTSGAGQGASSITSRTVSCKVKGGSRVVSGLSWENSKNRYMQGSAIKRLRPNTEYEITFSATNNLDITTTKKITVKTNNITAPTGKPTSLAISPSKIIPSSSLTISWKKPTSNLGTDVGTYGYEVWVYKNNKVISIDKILPNDSYPGCYWTTSTSAKDTSWKKPGEVYNKDDKIKFKIMPYRYYNSTLYTNSASAVTSSTYTVISDQATIDILTPDGWKKGKVFVKTESGWKAAIVIYAKSGSTWKKAKV